MNTVHNVHLHILPVSNRLMGGAVVRACVAVRLCQVTKRQIMQRQTST
jgi:hypothetical protein